MESISNMKGALAFVTATVVAALSVVTSIAEAGTWYVSPNGSSASNCAFTREDPGLCTKVFDKMWAAPAPSSWDEADEIIFLDGEYQVTSVLLNIKNTTRNYLIVRSDANDPSTVTIVGNQRGGENGRCFKLNGDILISGLTITNFFCGANATDSGGAVLCDSSASVISNCVFAGNRAGRGGAGYNGTYDSCLFVTNTSSSYNGAGALGFATANNCTFVNNRAAANNALGGAVRDVTALNCTFDGNYAIKAGAAYDSTCVDCTFTNNWSNHDDGAGAMQNGSAENCVFIDNYANGKNGKGGAIRDVTAINCVFDHNHAPYSGGAAYNSNCDSCTFTTNWSNTNNGGGAMYGGSATNCNFIGNYCYARNSSGGALNGNVEAYGCHFVSNICIGEVSGGSGGAASGGILRKCVFVGNHARDAGAVNNASVYDSFFTNNIANNWSGAVNGSGAASTAVSNCVFVGNQAISAAAVNNARITGCLVEGNIPSSGSAIMSSTVVNSTIVGNEGGNGAVGSGCTLVNTLLADNTPRDISANITANSSLYGNAGTYTVSGSGNIIELDPLFNKGKDPGAPWYALSRKSPARDAGSDVGFTSSDVDLAGKCRICGIIDIGCYEYWPTLSPTVLLFK